MDKDNEEYKRIERARAGDQEAFRALIIQYEARILAYLFSLLGNQDTAYDLAQETFIAMYLGLPDWQPIEDTATRTHKTGQKNVGSLDTKKSGLLSPWLYRIATNKAINYIMRNKERLHLSYQALADQQKQRVSQKSGNDSHSIEEHYIMRELLSEALSQLSNDDAVCLVLRFVRGERYEEIAQRLGISKEAARKRISRSLATLRTTYGKFNLEVRP